LQFSGSPGQRFPLDLIAQTEALQERWCLGILHRRVLCSGIGYGRDLSPCILLLPDPCSMISLGSDLRSCILHGPDLSVLFHGPDPRWGILHHLYGGSLHGLCGPGLCPCLSRRRPCLELLEQFFSKWLANLGLALTGLALTGLALTDLDSALIGRFNRRSNFVARRRIRCGRRQILSAGDCLNC
jgi:hypothetical protein